MEKITDTKYKEYLEKKIRNTIRDYHLFNKKDKIAVAVSGGKDSTTCLYVLHKLGYNIEAITIDAAIGNYTKKNLENIKEVCEKYDINLRIISFREEFGKSLCYIQSVLKQKGHDYHSCMLCGILKRYLLNKYSREWGFSHLATGHNLDDEAQAFMMNVFRNDFNRATRQGHIAGISRSAKFVRRIKPLYQITEAEVIRYSKLMKFPVNYEICPCSTNAYRRQFINILDEFEKKHPSVKYNVIRFHESMMKQTKKENIGEINECVTCGEPSSQKICKTCHIIKQLAEHKE